MSEPLAPLDEKARDIAWAEMLGDDVGAARKAKIATIDKRDFDDAIRAYLSTSSAAPAEAVAVWQVFIEGKNNEDGQEGWVNEDADVIELRRAQGYQIRALGVIASPPSTPDAAPVWQTMDTAPKDGSEFIASKRWPGGKIELQTYKYEGPPNYWNSVGGCTCIRPEYQSDYLWTPLPSEGPALHPIADTAARLSIAEWIEECRKNPDKTMEQIAEAAALYISDVAVTVPSMPPLTDRMLHAAGNLSGLSQEQIERVYAAFAKYAPRPPIADTAALDALREVRSHFKVEYSASGGKPSVGYDNEALPKVIALLDAALSPAEGKEQSRG